VVMWPLVRIKRLQVPQFPTFPHGVQSLAIITTPLYTCKEWQLEEEFICCMWFSTTNHCKCKLLNSLKPNYMVFVYLRPLLHLQIIFLFNYVW
jgi:hypothetical protein